MSGRWGAPKSGKEKKKEKTGRGSAAAIVALSAKMYRGSGRPASFEQCYC